MDGREQNWRDRVAQAALARDADALHTLYAEATELFGSEAGAHWAQALSAYDASAVTG